jgi:nitrogen fixation protein FixH
MKITWNWGTKLVIAMATFMLMVIAFVVVMFQQEISLVEKDYYPRGQAYQEMIQQVQNTAPYADDIHAEVVQNGLRISFPAFFRPEATQGIVHFFHRISDKHDLHVRLSLNEEGVFTYPAQDLKGRYVLKISWQQDDIDYYTEKSITFK